MKYKSVNCFLFSVLSREANREFLSFAVLSREICIQSACLAFLFVFFLFSLPALHFVYLHSMMKVSCEMGTVSVGI